MKRKLKAAFILPSLANRGPVVFTAYLVNELVKLIDLVDVYYFDDIREVQFDCDSYKIKSISDIDYGKYNIVQTTMFRPDVYLALNKNRLCQGAILISGMHNYILEDMQYNYGKVKGYIISTLWMLMLKRFDALVYSSNEMVNYYSCFLGQKRYSKIPYGIGRFEFSNVELEFENEIKSLSSRYTILGAVGLLIKRKGFHQLIESLKYLSDCALILIGDGPEKESLMNLALAEGVSERIIFTGFQNNSKEYYKYLDIYCMSSYSEGFGLAMLEALSCKIPLICSNLNIYKEFFNNRDVGIFSLDNIDSLVGAVVKVKSDLALFSRSSFELFEKNFEVNVMAKKHLDFYNELLDCYE
ncbi:glycosyltransferase family 4 protein [Shewanella sp. AS16]|uniref:glycosyltransferase family 4 protein n=1 Tax=Shewanella sp. AS16 TaxID=2907625 RepID=UPI001F318616|nr:glycosyltransferase family 4 protein [Shewanella sp. AS16]MCE9686734.1 glycosyltransferase family 4 protein [Shewanella sp. AS16]